MSDRAKASRVPEGDLLERIGREDLLLDYQKRLLQTTALHRVVVCEKSRRIGFTWAIAVDAVMTAASGKSAGGMDVFYLAYEKEMTREFIDTCAAWADLLSDVAGGHSGVEEYVYEEDRDKSVMAFRIRFASGYEIVALSSSPRGLRGRQGYVIIDEAAFHDQLDEVLKAAMALLIWGGKVLVISTHNGVDNPYNRLVEEVKAGKKKYGFIRVTFDDAIRDGLYRRRCLVQGAEWSAEDERAWRDGIVADYGDAADEELFCIPAEGGGAWIAPELIAAATHPEAGRRDQYKGGPAYGGNDIARRRDQWVSTVGEKIGPVFWQRDEQILVNKPFSEHDAVIADQFRFFRLVRLAMDQTGIGERSVEEMQRAHGSHRIEGVIMAGDRRLNIATVARRAFEDGLVRIKDDPELRASIRLIKRVAGATGHPRLVTGRDGRDHADRAWALFLAIAAAAEGAPVYGYKQVAARQGQGAAMNERDRYFADRDGDGFGRGAY